MTSSKHESERIGYRLKRAQQALRSAMDVALRDLGVTTPQYSALLALEGAEPLSGAELARRCFVTPQTMNGILVALEKSEWVTRAPHAEHGRVIETRLTSSGGALLRKAHKVVGEIEEMMLMGLSAAQRRTLGAALRRCTENLEQGHRSAVP